MMRFPFVTLMAALCGTLATSLSPAKAQQSHLNYNDLAIIISEPIFERDTITKARQQYEDGNVIARKEYERQRLLALSRLEGKLLKSKEKSSQALQNCYTTYQEIRRLDSRAPDYEGTIRQALTASPAAVKSFRKQDLTTEDRSSLDAFASKAIWEIGGLLVNAYNIKSEQQKYQKFYAFSRGTNLKVINDLVDDRYAVSRTVASLEKPALGIKITPSFANTYLNDIIEIRNDSGKNLTACTLLITLNGLHALSEKEESETHFHFTQDWPAGQVRYLWYPSRAFSGVATNESVDVVQKVKVDLYCDQLKTNITYQLAGQAYNDQLKLWADKHLIGSNFSGRWYTDSENLVDPAGFEVKYSGSLTSFTVKKVVVEAIDNTRAVRIYSPDREWISGQKKWICHKNFNSINPSKIKLTISFVGSSYEHSLTWTLRK